VLGLAAATGYQFQLVALRGTLGVNAVFGALSNVASGTTGAVTVTATQPGMVTDLAVAGVTASSVTLAFTEVSDGTGQPASYDIRSAPGTLAWGAATDVAQGTCAVPLAGTSIGAKRTCTVLGLAAATGYQFQLVAFRGTLGVNAVFGALSNVASGTTAAATAPVVASVTVSPASASLTVGATQQFAAILKDAVGNTLTGQAISWVSSAPAVATVSGSGLATGVAAGTATISATSGGVTGTGAVTVTATQPGTVTDLAVAGVTASSVTLAFTEVNDGTGQPASYDIRSAPGTLVWGAATDVAQGTCAVPLAGTSIGAKRTCTVLGLAAATGYQFQLVALRGTLGVNAVFGALSNVVSATSGGVSGSAALTVNPDPAPGTAWPNEPAGFTTVTDYRLGTDATAATYDPLSLGSSGWSVQWNPVGNGTVAVDPTAPVPSAVYQVMYPSGWIDGSAPSTLNSPMFNNAQVYVGWWWKPSNPWQTDPSGTNKIAFLWAGNVEMFISMHWFGSYYALEVGQEMRNAGAGNYDPNITTTPITLGQWHRIEWYANATSGAMEVWLDGVLQTRVTPGFPGAFTMFQLSPTWGGCCGNTKSETDYYWYNYAHVSVQ
jgi:hypothetical protein